MRGIEIEELAAITRIPLRSLERLESGCFDGQADGFVRMFVRTVAEALGLDPEDVVARMLSEVEISYEVPSRVVAMLGRVAVAACALLVVAGLLGLGRWVLQSRSGAADRAVEERIYRWDPVRALADAQGTPEPPSLRPGAPIAGPRDTPGRQRRAVGSASPGPDHE
jgi:hypothetical protein